MKRLAIIALSALALAGCGSTTKTATHAAKSASETEAAHTCVLTKSGTKLCGQEALNWCDQYAEEADAECNHAKVVLYTAEDRKELYYCEKLHESCEYLKTKIREVQEEKWSALHTAAEVIREERRRDGGE